MVIIDWYMDDTTLYAIFYRGMRTLVKNTNPKAKTGIVYLTE